MPRKPKADANHAPARYDRLKGGTVKAVQLLVTLDEHGRLWEAVLIGVRWATPWTMLLGLIEAFLLGALGAWGITAVYRAFPHRLTR